MDTPKSLKKKHQKKQEEIFLNFRVQINTDLVSIPGAL